MACIYIILAVLSLAAGYPVHLSSANTDGLATQGVQWGGTAFCAVAVTLVLIVVFAGCLCCHPSKGFQEFRNSNTTLSVTEFVNPLPSPPGQALNREHSELTIFPPSAAPAPPTLRPAAFSSGDQPFSVHDWFDGGSKKLLRTQLQFLEELGRGWFGKIVLAEAHFIYPNQPRTKVVVKMLHEDATSTDQMYFLHELKPHRDLDHPNVLPLLASCLDQQPFLLVLEACPNGDVKTFLQQSGASGPALCASGVPVRMARDIARAVTYMHQNRFVHTDLAARNALVTRDLTVKLGDYGNSIELHPTDYYIAGSVALPVRWCAPETLACTHHTIETREVTQSANVWSLAVTMWEILELGRLPYSELSDDVVIAKVLDRTTPNPVILPSPKPTTTPHTTELYNLMKLCWQPPLQRPTAAQLTLILDNLVSSGGPSAADEPVPDAFDAIWSSSKPNYIPVTDNTVPAGRGARVADSSLVEPKGAFTQPVYNEKIGSPRLRLTNESNHPEQPASWLAGVDADTEEELKLVRDVSDAIRDLDAALEMEKTSSSEESSHTSPEKEIAKKAETGPKGSEMRKSDRNPFETEGISGPDSDLFKTGETSFGTESSVFVPRRFDVGAEGAKTMDKVETGVQFKLGDVSSVREAPKSFLQDTCEPVSLLFPVDPSPLPSLLFDVEDAMWAARIERAEFTEKVREKSRSIADLMVLTHIDVSDDSDSDKERSLGLRLGRTSLTYRGSESDVRNAVLEESFHESLKRLSNEHKETGHFDSLNILLPRNKEDFLWKSASEQKAQINRTNPFLQDLRLIGSNDSCWNLESVPFHDSANDNFVRVFNSPSSQVQDKPSSDIITKNIVEVGNPFGDIDQIKEKSGDSIAIPKPKLESESAIDDVLKESTERRENEVVFDSTESLKLRQNEANFDKPGATFESIERPKVRQSKVTSDKNAVTFDSTESPKVSQNEVIIEEKNATFESIASSELKQNEGTFESTKTPKVRQSEVTVEKQDTTFELTERPKMSQNEVTVNKDITSSKKYVTFDSTVSSKVIQNEVAIVNDVCYAFTPPNEVVESAENKIKTEKFDLTSLEKETKTEIPVTKIKRDLTLFPDIPSCTSPSLSDKDEDTTMVTSDNQDSAIGSSDEGLDLPNVELDKTLTPPTVFDVSIVTCRESVNGKVVPNLLSGTKSAEKEDNLVSFKEKPETDRNIQNLIESSPKSHRNGTESEKKIEEQGCVSFGPFEEHSLNYYQAVCTKEIPRENAPATILSESGWNGDEAEHPDDERSCDSGFRDKGSLSESVEDDPKYNLEDIEAELEEAFAKGNGLRGEVEGEKTAKSIKVNSEKNRFEGTSSEQPSAINFEFEETKFYETGEESEPEGDLDTEYLPNDDDDDLPQRREDDDFVQMLRMQLVNALPQLTRSYEKELEEVTSELPTINIDYSSSILAPIQEDDVRGVEGGVSPSQKRAARGARKTPSPLVTSIDTETFAQYLDFMVEHEGQHDLLQGDESPSEIMFRKEPTSLSTEEFKAQMGALLLQQQQEHDSLVMEDLEDMSLSHTLPHLLNNSPRHMQVFEAFGSGEGSLSEEACTDMTSSPDLLSDVSGLTPDKTPMPSPRIQPRTSSTPVVSEQVLGTDSTQNYLDSSENSPLRAPLGNSSVRTKINSTENSPSRAPLDTTSANIAKVPEKVSDTSSVTENVSVAGATPVTQLDSNDEAKVIMEALGHLQSKESKPNDSVTSPASPMEMLTSFCGDDDYDDDDYGRDPDWDSDSRSSSGEFVWKHGSELADNWAELTPAFPLVTEENDDDSCSDSASVTDFVPSAWDSQAAPSKSALRPKDRIKDSRRVSFKKEKYHCVYEYPREPSDAEDDVAAVTANPLYSQFSQWQTDLDNCDLYGADDESDPQFAISSSERPFMTGSQFWASAPSVSADLWSSSEDMWCTSKPARHNLTLDLTSPSVEAPKHTTPLPGGEARVLDSPLREFSPVVDETKSELGEKTVSGVVDGTLSNPTNLDHPVVNAPKHSTRLSGGEARVLDSPLTEFSSVVDETKSGLEDKTKSDIGDETLANPAVNAPKPGSEARVLDSPLTEFSPLVDETTSGLGEKTKCGIIDGTLAMECSNAPKHNTPLPGGEARVLDSPITEFSPVVDETKSRIEDETLIPAEPKVSDTTRLGDGTKSRILVEAEDRVLFSTVPEFSRVVDETKSQTEDDTLVPNEAKDSNSALLDKLSVVNETKLRILGEAEDRVLDSPLTEFSPLVDETKANIVNGTKSEIGEKSTVPSSADANMLDFPLIDIFSLVDGTKSRVNEETLVPIVTDIKGLDVPRSENCPISNKSQIEEKSFGQSLPEAKVLDSPLLETAPMLTDASKSQIKGKNSVPIEAEATLMDSSIEFPSVLGETTKYKIEEKAFLENNSQPNFFTSPPFEIPLVSDQATESFLDIERTEANKSKTMNQTETSKSPLGDLASI